MNAEFEYHLDRVRAIHAFMLIYTIFTPDEMEESAVADLEGDSEAFYEEEYLAAQVDFTLALGTVEEGQAALHTACIAVYAMMKSRYRTMSGALRSINKLPVQDQTMEQTLDRAKQMIQCWKKLPLPPNQPVPPLPALPLFIPFPGMTLAIFEGMRTALMTAQDDVAGKRGVFEDKEGLLHDRIKVLNDFTVNALVQARAQFPSGAAREVIDAIPVEPSTEAPGAASFTRAESTAPGKVELLGNAPHASKFDFFHKPPGAPDFTLVADDSPLALLILNGLAAGDHEFKVEGVNSKGNGPESAVAVVTVA